MSYRASQITVVFMLVAIGAVGAHAQQSEPEQPPPSYAAMISNGEGVVKLGAGLSQAVSGMLADAQRDNDVMRVTCLNDKLTQIDGNLRTAQQRLLSLRKAKDQSLREHEHTMLQVLGQKLAVLERESNQCVGQDLYETGETENETVIDSDMLPFEDDPSSPPSVLPPTMPTIAPAGTGSE